MNARFLSPAQNELHKAIKYYNEQRPGLGFEFANEIIVIAVMNLYQKPLYWKKRL